MSGAMRVSKLITPRASREPATVRPDRDIEVFDLQLKLLQAQSAAIEIDLDHLEGRLLTGPETQRDMSIRNEVKSVEARLEDMLTVKENEGNPYCGSADYERQKTILRLHIAEVTEQQESQNKEVENLSDSVQQRELIVTRFKQVQEQHSKAVNQLKEGKDASLTMDTFADEQIAILQSQLASRQKSLDSQTQSLAQEIFRSRAAMASITNQVEGIYQGIETLQMTRFGTPKSSKAEKTKAFFADTTSTTPRSHASEFFSDDVSTPKSLVIKPSPRHGGVEVATTPRSILKASPRNDRFSMHTTTTTPRSHLEIGNRYGATATTTPRGQTSTTPRSILRPSSTRSQGHHNHHQQQQQLQNSSTPRSIALASPRHDSASRNHPATTPRSSTPRASTPQSSTPRASTPRVSSFNQPSPHHKRLSMTPRSILRTCTTTPRSTRADAATSSSGSSDGGIPEPPRTDDNIISASQHRRQHFFAVEDEEDSINETTATNTTDQSPLTMKPRRGRAILQGILQKRTARSNLMRTSWKKKHAILYRCDDCYQLRLADQVDMRKAQVYNIVAQVSTIRAMTELTASGIPASSGSNPALELRIDPSDCTAPVLVLSAGSDYRAWWDNLKDAVTYAEISTTTSLDMSLQASSSGDSSTVLLNHHSPANRMINRGSRPTTPGSITMRPRPTLQVPVQVSGSTSSDETGVAIDLDRQESI